jgi:hypothetical protein
VAPIATAFVRLVPDTTGFRTTAERQIGVIRPRVVLRAENLAATRTQIRDALKDIKIAIEPDVQRFKRLLLLELRNWSVKVKVEPDLTGFVARIGSHIAGLRFRVRVEPNLAGFRTAVRTALSHMTLTVDLNVNRAFLRREVQMALAAGRFDIRIRAIIDADSGDVHRLREELHRLGQSNVDRATSSMRGLNFSVLDAVRSVLSLSIAFNTVGSLGVAVGAVAFAVAALGAAAISAAAGLGVSIFALTGVVGALKALSAARDADMKSAAAEARQNNQVANASDQLRSAVVSLAMAKMSAASSARNSALSIANAERGLADAQRTALRAQEDLNDARKSAAEALQDLSSQVANNSLAVRQANLDLADAKQNLDKVLADPSATQRQRAEAQLTYDRAVQQLNDLTVRHGRLKVEQADAAKKGVEGSDLVRNATDRLKDAQRGVVDAERRIAEARADAADAAKQSAFQVSQAMQAVAAAQRNMATALQTNASTAGAAMDTLKRKMEELSPVGRKFVDFIFNLKDEFLALRRAAETGFLPGFQRGIESLLPHLKAFEGFILRVGQAMGVVVERMLTGFTSDRWRPFFEYIDRTAVPVILQLGRIVENLGLGIANIFVGFAPMQTKMLDFLTRISEKFLAWSETVGGLVEEFLIWRGVAGPLIEGILMPLLSVVGELGKAIGGPLTRVIAEIAPHVERFSILLSGTLHAAIDALRPVLDKVADKLIDLIPRILDLGLAIIDNLLPFLEAIAPAAVAFAEAIGDFLIQASDELIAMFKEMAPYLQRIAEDMGPGMVRIVEAFGDAMLELIPIIPQITDLLILTLDTLDKLGPMWEVSAQASVNSFKVLGAFFRGYTVVIGLILNGIAAILDVAGRALDLVPGFDEESKKFRTAARELHDIAEKTLGDIETKWKETEGGIEEASRKIRDNSITPLGDAHDPGLTGKVRGAVTQIGRAYDDLTIVMEQDSKAQREAIDKLEARHLTLEEKTRIVGKSIKDTWDSLTHHLMTDWAAIDKGVIQKANEAHIGMAGEAKKATTAMEDAWGGFKTKSTSDSTDIRNFAITPLGLAHGDLRTTVDRATLLMGGSWNGLRGSLTGTYGVMRSTIFDPLMRVITTDVPNAFARGRDAAAGAFDGLKSRVAATVVSAINTTNRLIGGFNTVASAVGTGTIGAVSTSGIGAAAIGGLLGRDIPGFAAGGPARLPVGFHAAVGGRLPGMPSSRDNMLAVGPGGRMIKLATGEFIVNAKDTAENLPLLERINARHGRKPRRGFHGHEGVERHYQLGGLVGNALLSSLATAGNAAKWIREIVSDALINAISGSGSFPHSARTGVTRQRNAVASWAADKAAAWQAAQVPMMSPLGGGVGGVPMPAGPGGGGNPASGVFTRYASGWPGRIRGMPSRNTLGAQQFIRATWGIPSHTDHTRYLRMNDPYDHSWGKALDNMTSAFTPRGKSIGDAVASWFIANPRAWGTKYVIWNRRITSGGGWRGYSGASAHTDHVHVSFFAKGGPIDKLTSAIGNLRVFDRGGAWPSGTLGMNTSGQTEYVSTGASMSAVVHKLDQLIAAVEHVAPGVGAALGGQAAGLRQMARAR